MIELLQNPVVIAILGLLLSRVVPTKDGSLLETTLGKLLPGLWDRIKKIDTKLVSGGVVSEDDETAVMQLMSVARYCRSSGDEATANKLISLLPSVAGLSDESSK